MAPISPSLRGVYEIVNERDGMCYVGFTAAGFGQRFAAHRGKLRRGTHPNHPLQGAYNDHGEGAFVFHPLMTFDSRKEALEAEVAALAWYRQRDRWADVYNLEVDMGAPSEETIAKIRESCRAAQNSEETRARLAVTHATPEFRARMSAALKLAWSDPEKLARLSAAGKRAQNRPEVRARNSAALKRASASPEARARLATSAARGRATIAATPEVRERISATQKLAQNRPEVRAAKSAAMKRAWAARRATK